MMPQTNQSHYVKLTVTVHNKIALLVKNLRLKHDYIECHCSI